MMAYRGGVMAYIITNFYLYGKRNVFFDCSSTVSGFKATLGARRPQDIYEL
jgi:hypothetical protein